MSSVFVQPVCCTPGVVHCVYRHIHALGECNGKLAIYLTSAIQLRSTKEAIPTYLAAIQPEHFGSWEATKELVETVRPLCIGMQPDSFSTFVFKFINPLSQEGGGGGVVAIPPFRIFPRAVSAFLLRLPFGQFTYLCPDTHVSTKKFSKIFRVKNVGGGGGRGVATTRPPSS